MLASLRRTRSVATLASIGALAFALSGCSAITGGDAPKEEASATAEAVESEAATAAKEAETAEASETATPEPTEEATTEASSDASAGATEGLATGPFSEEDKKAAAQVLSDMMQKTADGDYAGACSLVVDTSQTPIEPITDQSMLDICGSVMESSMGEGDAEMIKQVKELFVPENITVEDLGDGSASLKILGEDAGMKAVKLENGKVYLDIAGL